MASQQKARILLLHRYYWPDTPPYGHILRAIATQLAADGHAVEVLSTQPCYKQSSVELAQPRVTHDGDIRVTRIRLKCEVGRGPLLRIWNLIRYLCSVALYALRRRRFDIVMTATTPAVFAGLAGRIARRIGGGKLIYHCMDLHPESGQCSGDFSDGWITQLLARTERKTCLCATRIVVLSEDMRQSMIARDSDLASRIIIVNNFTTPTEPTGDDGPGLGNPDPGTLRIIYAGNVGRFQGLEAIIDALATVDRTTPVELLIVGDGKALNAMRQRTRELAEDRVTFLPHQPAGVASQLVRTAQIGIVSLQPDIFRYAYPSKTMFYLGEGTPVLCTIEPESELGRMVISEDLGLVVPSGDIEAIADAIRIASERFQECPDTRSRIEQFALERFGRDLTLDIWSNLIRTLIAPTPK